MITNLKLTNFKRHEALEINLSGGLQALRGANEAGKSTVFRAIAYALFGSRALELSLEDTVTWGKPVSTLKVELSFIHNKVNYTITRKKSGAELVSSDGVTASGQAEVTAFIERLFGANANIAQATMLANQSSLQDGLDSSAMPLIERLANMRLIDELIDKVQQKLPSGSTKGLEAQIHAVQADQKPVLDTAEAEAQLKTMREEHAAFMADVKQAEVVLAEQTLLAKSGQAKQASNAKSTALINLLESQIAEATVKLTIPHFDKPDIAAMEEALQQQELREEKVKAFAKFSALPEVKDPTATEDFTSREEDAALYLKQWVKAFNDARVDLAAAKASMIDESSCSFCGKNFSDVPEVATKIEQSQRLIRDIQERMDVASAEKTKFEGSLSELALVKKQADNLRKLFPIKFAVLDESTIPPVPKWEGGDVSSEIATVTKADLLRAKEAIKAREKLLTQAESAKLAIDKAEEQLKAVEFLEISKQELEAMLVIDANTAEISDAKKSLQRMESAIKDCEHKISLAVNTFKHQTAAYEAAVQQKKELLELLSTYHFNNGIVQKLREARPAVAAKLWALVLTGVSHYFSAIRGTQSTVTRGEKGFLIDGKVVEAYSGSTRDSLGLAIRIMLQKTFLPNVTFMLVDEPGAAFDDSRESDMLAVLASCGLEQVVLVTHSDLADTFASNVVQI